MVDFEEFEIKYDFGFGFYCLFCFVFLMCIGFIVVNFMLIVEMVEMV